MGSKPAFRYGHEESLATYNDAGYPQPSPNGSGSAQATPTGLNVGGLPGFGAPIGTATQQLYSPPSPLPYTSSRDGVPPGFGSQQANGDKSLRYEDIPNAYKGELTHQYGEYDGPERLVALSPRDLRGIPLNAAMNRSPSIKV